LLSGARTLWVQVFLCPIILLPISKKSTVVKSLFKPAAIAAILLILFLLRMGTVSRDISEELGQRVSETFALIRATRQVAPVLLTDRRIVETRAALNTLTDPPNILNYVVGFGNGAEFYAPSAALGMGSEPGYKHHIHNGYVSMLFRMGIFGLGIFLLFVLSMLRNMYCFIKYHSGKPETSEILISKTVFVYFVATLVELLTIYSFIGDIKWGVLFGLYRCASQQELNISD